MELICSSFNKMGLPIKLLYFIIISTIKENNSFEYIYLINYILQSQYISNLLLTVVSSANSLQSVFKCTTILVPIDASSIS